MLAMLLAAVSAPWHPVATSQRAEFRSSAVSASAMAMGRILEGVTIDYRGPDPVGARPKRTTALLIDGQHVAATLIEFP
jgi:hypothetical protein